MAQSPFAFFRGCAIVQARDLAATPVSGPVVQLRGDCHIADFGGFATPERNLVFDITSFDETFPDRGRGDVKRLATSLVLAARDRGFSKSVAREAAIEAAAAYRSARRNMRGSRRSTCGTGRSTLRILPISSSGTPTCRAIWARSKSMPASERPKRSSETRDHPGRWTDHRGRSAADLSLPPARRGSRSSKYRAFPALSPLAERRTAHASRSLSFGGHRNQSRGHRQRRYALRRGAFYVGFEQDPLFLQIEEARRIGARLPSGTERRYKHQGERVVDGQRLMQAASDIFLGWTELPDAHEYYVRPNCAI